MSTLGLAYVHIPVVIGAIGTADVAAFDTAIRESPNPIVAHCRTGTRSYLLWAAGQPRRRWSLRLPARATLSSLFQTW